MTVAAVSQRVDEHPHRSEARDALDQQLGALLLAAGALPVPVPNALGDDEAALGSWLDAVGPGLLVLSGGNDVGERPERDRTEAALLEHAQRHRLPVLGICRGMQMMAVWAGGSLKPVEGHVRSRHRLADLSGIEVNSFHDQALVDCPAGYEVIARSEDGEIEAIRHLSLPWEGCMWHPEREPHPQTHDLERVRRLCATEPRVATPDGSGVDQAGDPT